LVTFPPGTCVHKNVALYPIVIRVLLYLASAGRRGEDDGASDELVWLKTNANTPSVSDL
jgi:hypothetical protein